MQFRTSDGSDGNGEWTVDSKAGWKPSLMPEFIGQFAVVVVMRYWALSPLVINKSENALVDDRLDRLSEMNSRRSSNRSRSDDDVPPEWSTVNESSVQEHSNVSQSPRQKMMRLFTHNSKASNGEENDFSFKKSDSGSFSASDSKSSYEDIDSDEDIDLDLIQLENVHATVDLESLSSAADDDEEEEEQKEQWKQWQSRNYPVMKVINQNVISLTTMVLIGTFYLIMSLLLDDGIFLDAIGGLLALGGVVFLASVVELVLIMVLKAIDLCAIMRLVAKNHLRYFISVVLTRLFWTQLLDELPANVVFEVNRALLTIVIVDLLWLLWMMISRSVVSRLKKSTFGKDVYQIVLQERGLQRLCCQTEDEIEEWIDYEKHKSNSFRHFSERVERILKGTLVIPLRRVVKRKQRGRICTWKFSTSIMIGVRSAEELGDVIDIMWKNLTIRAGSESVVTIHEWKQLYKNKDFAYKTFSSFFHKKLDSKDDSHEFTFSDFSKAVISFFDRRSRVESMLWNWESLARMTLNLSQVVFWLCMIFVSATLYGIPMSGVLLTLSSLMLSLAFAFGSVVSEVVNSAIFIFVTKPFDVGDFVRIGVNGGLIQVANIGLLTTSFIAIDNQRVMIYNTKLIQADIYNLRRSTNAQIKFIFEVSFHTSREKLNELREHIYTFIKSKEGTWKKKLEFFVASPVKTHSMFLNIWLENRLNFQNVIPLARAKTEFVNIVREKIDELGIHCDPPTHPLKIQTTNALDKTRPGFQALPKFGKRDGRVFEAKSDGSV